MILVIDNYDSFTYNLVQYVGQCGAEVLVRRNDEITIEEIEAMRPEGILLSPGPCTPTESGICVDILQAALSGKLQMPIFGVCLGHQAIGQAAGAVVARAGAVRHGKTSPISHDGKGVFEGIPSPFQAVRYHSLSVRPDSLPSGFVVSATADDDGEIMGLRHESLSIEGVQFHPESVLTEHGLQIVENFVRKATASPIRR